MLWWKNSFPRLPFKVFVLFYTEHTNIRMTKLVQSKGPSSPILLLFPPQCLLVATMGDRAAWAYTTFPSNTFTVSKHFQLWGFSELDSVSLLILNDSFFHSDLLKQCDLLYQHPLPGSLQVYYLVEKSQVSFTFLKLLPFGRFYTWQNSQFLSTFLMPPAEPHHISLSHD